MCSPTALNQACHFNGILPQVVRVGTAPGCPSEPLSLSLSLCCLPFADQNNLAGEAHAASEHHRHNSIRIYPRVGNHCSRNWLSRSRSRITKVSRAFELPLTAPFGDPFHTKFEACVYCPLKQPLFYGKCCSNCLLRRALCNTHAQLKENHSGIVYRDLMAQLILLHLFLRL